MRIEAASRMVRCDDVVTITLDRIRILKIIGFAERRGPASETARLYEDLSPVLAAAAGELRPDAPTKRPTSDQRRDILRLKRSGNG